MEMKVIKTLAAAACLVLAGCSDSGGSSEAKEVEQGRIWDKSEVVEAVGLSQDEGRMWWHFTTEGGVRCDVAVIMTTSNAVELYASAGDAVATNADRTAGLKITAAETKTCLEAANKLMSALD